MFGWTKIFTFVALAAVAAIVTGGAGATSTSTLAGGTGATSRSTLAPATVSHAATARKVSTAAVSKAASRPGTLLKTTNLSTRSRVVRYLRAIGLDPRGVTIQRGARNYAGPNCPGAGWSCTSTAHPVVQIAAAGGKNTFLCTTGRCAVVQATSATATSTSRSFTAATATNTAKCIKTTGLSQSCSIDQNSASANNEAIVYENAVKASGLTQTASATAQITQRATGSNTNKACVLQNINVEGSTAVDKKGVPVTVTLEAHQSISITQDSATGGNALASATSAGSCAGDRLMQIQTLTSKASGSGLITQNQNASSGGPNVLLDIKQNQSEGFLGVASGFNTAKFTQSNTLTAVASTPAGPVNQTQSSAVGGIQATVNQFSTSPSTIDALQDETQCEDALNPGPPLNCGTTADPPSYSLTQVQYGPVRKGGGPSTQGNNSGDVFNVVQNSTQNNDTGQNQTNDVQADCSTSGNCTVTQTTNVDGQTTTNVQSGQNVTTNITCTGTTCTKPSTIIPVVNGSFEADTFGYNGTLDLGGTNPLTGWTTLHNGTYPWGLPYPNYFTAGPTPYGNQWVIVGDYGNGGTWIEQTLNGLTPGHTYNLNFAAASELPNGGGQSLLGVSFPSGSNTPGQTIAAPLTQVNYWDTWASFSVSFTASNSSVTFRFTGLAASFGSDPGIDNVSVTG